MKAGSSTFFCRECGYESAKWSGQCPSCRAWNSMVEEPASRGKTSGKTNQPRMTLPSASYLKDVALEDHDRYKTGFTELDRVLGGGIVSGSLVLFGGDPGIGKSTLLLQVCRNLAEYGKKVLYISGEESLKQIKMRAERIGGFSGDIRFMCETDLDDIGSVLENEKPDVAVIDSIQTMYREDVSSSPGSVSQVREATNVLLKIAKGNSIAVLIVGHVTKEGQVAGPRVLEHMVDAVLYFEGERSSSYRIIRGVKNRFGSTNEIGVFEMRNEGLVQVPNPSEYMLSGRPTDASGAVVSCSMEGTRPMLFEVQALVNRTAFGLPRRTAAGFDSNRVNLLLAVLENRCRMPMSQYDTYINIAGGMKMTEPAIDLAVITAVVSSFRDVPVPENTIIFGEVGLSGEVRAVPLSEYRVREAAKLGFTRCILPAVSLGKFTPPGEIRCTGISSVKEVMGLISEDGDMRQER